MRRCVSRTGGRLTATGGCNARAVVIHGDNMKASVLVEAPCGRVRGFHHGDIVRFLGIPYAEPPLGRYRFAAPRTKVPFKVPFIADSYGPAAPQRPPIPGPLAKIAGLIRELDEDCLNLHVFTPGVDGRRPVLVFIHGGGFIIGAGAQYPGDDLARRGDAVVVTLNYRLGFLGFNGFAELFADDDRFAANAGLLDQRLALRWVRDNIAAFGGDPDAVTIAGESAGAVSVACHLAAKASQHLYHQAIMQSGSLNLLYPRDKAGRVAEVILRTLSPNGDRERLFRLGPRAFGLAYKAVAKRFAGVPSRPYLDGTDLPEIGLAEAYARVKAVPLLIGTNRDEFSLFCELPLFQFETEIKVMADWVESVAGKEAAQRIGKLYLDDRRGRIAFGTDMLFRMAAIHQADAHAARAKTYAYRLDWEAKGLLSHLGATHSVDLPLLFEEFMGSFRSAYLGFLPDAKRFALSERMRNHWMAFVRTGSPLDDWPAYDGETRETMIFGERDAVMADPDKARRVAWQGVDGPIP